MKENETKGINIKASAWTIGVHVVLLLLFLLIKYSAPASETPIVEMGMEVNLGTSDNGSGTDQPMAVGDPAPDEASVKYKSAAQQSSNPREVEETTEADAPAVSRPVTTNKNKPNNNTAANANNSRANNSRETVNNTNTRPQRPRYTYNGSTGNNGNGATENRPGTSEGNTQGTGDRGVPNGTPGASNYTGQPGRGNGGISHNLAGRNIIAFPPPDADFREGGRVVIRITVNKAGAIVNKQVKSASNAEIRAIALRKVDKIKFNKSDDAPEEQFGDVTFVFKTRS